MRILAVEDNPKDLNKITGMISTLLPDSEILQFSDGLEALAEARKQEVDVAFLGIESEEISGMELGQYLRDLNPMINLIFTSKDKDQAYDAICLRASGYLIRPPKKKDVQKELSDLRYPEGEKRRKRVFAQTFGNFELFIDGKPVAFKYSRTKEVVALLVNNRGAQTTNGEIIASLWEDDGDPDKKGSYLRNLRQNLQNTLTQFKVANIILKQRGSMAIDVEKIECDLYDWLKDPAGSRYRYLGEYMNQYSWGEYLHAEIDEISYSLEE